MNMLAAKVTTGAVALLALIAAGLYVRQLRAEFANANHRLESARQGVADRDTVIGRLQRDAQARAKQQAKLNQTNDAIVATLATVQQENRRLIHENIELRAWADTALPADVIRMSASPALTGADGYSEYMSAVDAMQPASDGSSH